MLDPTSPSPSPRGAALRFSRRRFVRFLLGVSGVSALAALVGGGKPSPTTPGSPGSPGSSGGRVLAASLDSLPVGEGTVVAAGSGAAIVINTAEGVKAYSAFCTHARCLLEWDGPANRISCPCHVAFFDPLTGAVLEGPPPAPLPPLTAEIDGRDIYVVPG